MDWYRKRGHHIQTGSSKKRIELINSVLENMKNTEIQICDHIETKMNEIILKINQTYSILEADKLHSELRIFRLDFISGLY